MTYIVTFLSVMLGFGLAFAFRPKNRNVIKLLLSFSGAYLLSLTVMHLLPEVYEGAAHSHSHEGHTHLSTGIFILVGILFQIVLEFFSKGAEHGHVHHSGNFDHIPWALFVSLCVHAFLEGIPVSHHHELAWGIGVHHFPIAIILTLFFIRGNLSVSRMVFFMVVFASMTPLGTLLGETLPFINDHRSELSGIVVGILFHISSTIIFESNEHHSFNIYKLISIVLGFLLAIITL